MPSRTGRESLFCDGVRRRGFLKAGILGLGGIGLADVLRFRAIAADSNDFFLFNTVTKTLSYDADGIGAGVAVEIATFDNIDLVATDITFA